MLDIQTALLAPGKAGAVPTARFEVLREGLQECEARIAIDKALVSADKRIKLGPALAQKRKTCSTSAFRDMAPRREHPARGSRNLQVARIGLRRCLVHVRPGAWQLLVRQLRLGARDREAVRHGGRSGGERQVALPDAAVRDHPGCMREDQYESTPYPDVVSLAHEIRRSNGRLERR